MRHSGGAPEFFLLIHPATRNAYLAPSQPVVSCQSSVVRHKYASHPALRLPLSANCQLPTDNFFSLPPPTLSSLAEFDVVLFRPTDQIDPAPEQRIWRAST